jgi:hypothetical protein
MPVILKIVDLVEAQIPGAKKVVIPGAAHRSGWPGGRK